LITNYPSGSLLQEFQTEYSQLFVVYPLHCMQLSKNIAPLLLRRSGTKIQMVHTGRRMLLRLDRFSR